MSAAVSLNTLPEKNILIVDDTEEIRDLMVTLFSDEARVSTAVDGAEALTMVDHTNYDLIISDVDMPNLNGIDFYMHAVKKNNSIKNKFMFFTGSIDKQMREFIRESHIFYLPKPSPLHEIKLKANIILNNN
jgi:CheY-like chemotaxis protein